jgi:hypothetical protein
VAPPLIATGAAPQPVSALSAGVSGGRHIPLAGQYAAETQQPRYGIEPEQPPLVLEPEPEAAPPRRPPPPRQQPAHPAAAPQVDPKHIPEMSIARYAALCAACANQPERIQEIQIEYGLVNDRIRAALDAQWHDQFDDEPEMLTQWEQLFAQFRGQLRD